MRSVAGAAGQHDRSGLIHRFPPPIDASSMMASRSITMCRVAFGRSSIDAPSMEAGAHLDPCGSVDDDSRVACQVQVTGDPQRFDSLTQGLSGSDP